MKNMPRLRDGELATLEECWKWHLGLLGKEVRAECLDGEQYGRLLEVAFDGVVLGQPDGERVLPPECIQHLLLLSSSVSLFSDEALGVSTFGVDWQSRDCSTRTLFPAKAAQFCVERRDAGTKTA